MLINNIDSAQNAVGHLIARGHRKIGYVRGSFRIKAFQAREYGYRQALLDHGLELEPRWVVTVGTKTDSAYEGMLAYLDTKPELPTAFFVDNDLIAFGVMRALKDRGYRVPDDVSIVGFDRRRLLHRLLSGAHHHPRQQALHGLGGRPPPAHDDGRPKYRYFQDRKLHRICRTRQRQVV